MAASPPREPTHWRQGGGTSKCMNQGLQSDVVCLGWPIAPSYMSPNAGRGGELRGLSQWVKLYTGAQINFGDLTPYLTYGMNHITIKTRNPKCRLYWCLKEFIDWRYSQSCWYFRPLLWTSASLTFSLVDLPPPFPVRKSTGVCIYTVYNRVREGIGLCGEHLQELHNVYKTWFRTYTKLPYHPEQKPRRGGGPQSRQINTCRQIPL
jgi:hypothetical protein